MRRGRESESTSRGKSLKWAIACCCVLGSLRVAYLWIGGPVIPSRKLDALRPGMTQTQVSEILGEPTEITSDRQWTYFREPNPGWVAIYFDDQKRFRDINDESPTPRHQRWTFENLMNRLF